MSTFTWEIEQFSHGRTRSFRRGVAKAMDEEGAHEHGLPEGHEKAFEQGYELGKALKVAIAEAERPSPQDAAL